MADAGTSPTAALARSRLVARRSAQRRAYGMHVAIADRLARRGTDAGGRL